MYIIRSGSTVSQGNYLEKRGSAPDAEIPEIRVWTKHP
jgi:hypothetical protein